MVDFSTRLRQTLDQINKPLPSADEADVTATFFDTISPASIKWSDPRPDLADDADEWKQLMAMVDQAELHSMLDTLREIGTTLERQNTMYRLRPVIDPSGAKGFEDLEQFNAMRKHLMPYVGTLEGLMMQLHRRCGGR
jgi:hypothetical protein